MSAVTGLGLLDVAILEACAAAGADPDRPFVKAQRVLDVLHEHTGVGPAVAYEPLCDLARAWTVHLRLVEMHGNIGSRDGFGPANARYTECRLTPLGAAALASERGELGALPIGLINGDVHVGAHRPPLDPRRALAAIRAAVSATDGELVALLGRPVFPTGCDVEIDVDAWASGIETELVLSARVERAAATGALVISHLPPGSTTDEIASAVMSAVEMAAHPATRMIRDVVAGWSDGEPELAVHLRSGADVDDVRRFLTSLWGVRREMSACAGAPVAALVRRLDDPDRAALDARLAIVESAIGG